MVSIGTMRFLQKQKQESYTDQARRLAQGKVNNGYGYGSGYTAAGDFACKFVGRAAPDVLTGANVRIIEGDLFCPSSVPLEQGDRIQILSINGISMTPPQTFAITAGPIHTALGQEAALQLVPEA